ncbi:MAG: aldo/keto reductase [Clostridiales bacterium]|nr:aldo/keto reductase [Clostridiales bacterium]
MKYIDIDGIKASRLSLGCWRIADKPIENIERLVNTALDMGVNHFDHADIYGGGTCEKLYGELIKKSPSLRDRMVLQTKCGIMSGQYNLGYDHIMECVEGSLKRLNTDHVDILLLHRPDTLMRPEQIARAFDRLERDGKVLHFGVSNFSAMQIEYLQSQINQKILINQMQLSPTFCPMIDAGINVNTASPAAVDRDGGLLEYCRMRGITIQTYSTMQCSFIDENGNLYKGAFTTEAARKKYFALNFCLEGLARKYGSTPEAVAIAWVLHHPANMQAIVGTTLDKHMEAFKDCCEVPLTDREWYEIYRSAGHTLP